MLSKVTVYVVAKRGWTEFPLLSSALSALLESLSDGVAVGAGEESEEGVGLVGFWGAVVADGDSDVSGAVEGVDGVAEVFGVAVGEEGVAGFVDGLCEIMVLEEVPGFCLSTRAVGRPPPPGAFQSSLRARAGCTGIVRDWLGSGSKASQKAGRQDNREQKASNSG